MDAIVELTGTYLQRVSEVSAHARPQAIETTLAKKSPFAQSNNQSLSPYGD
ncbi:MULTISPECIES: hypothetical protein [unclassified Shewanella]|uniref:hypothetical protein n=1 Tax=unclassified Shewanella TaxID=196818 RepID=UPI001C7DF374|nr:MULTISPECIES: hypothetical protein [unclassified Shewanella]